MITSPFEDAMYGEVDPMIAAHLTAPTPLIRMSADATDAYVARRMDDSDDGARTIQELGMPGVRGVDSQTWPVPMILVARPGDTYAVTTLTDHVMQAHGQLAEIVRRRLGVEVARPSRACVVAAVQRYLDRNED